MCSDVSLHESKIFVGKYFYTLTPKAQGLAPTPFVASTFLLQYADMVYCCAAVW